MKKIYILFALACGIFALPHASLASTDSRFSISAISGDTTEAGGTATFTISLQEPIICADPLADCNVTIPVSSSNTNEGSLSVSEVTFTNTGWFTPQTVTVTGVDDDVADGEVSYSIVLGAVESNSEFYSGFNPADVSVVNDDNDSAGIIFDSVAGSISENGDSATVSIRLNSQPTADVTIGISSSDTTEMTVDTAAFVFTSENWSTPQTVTATGVDDDVVDGEVEVFVIFDPAVSDDSLYNGLDLADEEYFNADNEVVLPTITVSDVSGSPTEGGDTATFTVVLDAEIRRDVDIALTASDQIYTDVSELHFNSENWDIPQTVTVSAVDDFDAEADQSGTITFAVTSDDESYNGLAMDPVSMRVFDNDVELKTKGKYVNVLLDGLVIERKKVGPKKLVSTHRELRHKKLYRNKLYQTVAYLETRKGTAKLVVFRLTKKNHLKKRRLELFSVPENTPVQLRMRATHKIITATIGSGDTQITKTWHVTRHGNLKFLEE